VLAVFTLGFRHGFDVDHVAAIGDISAGSLTRRRTFFLCEVYVLGHALMVVIIGATLVVLAAYVLWSVATDRRPRTRGELFHRLLTRLRHGLRPRTTVVHEHDHVHGPGHDHAHADLPGPDVAAERTRTGLRHRHLHAHRDLPAPYSAGATMTIGFVHGLGAETPTQVLALAGGSRRSPPHAPGC
jgi:hypothetical protein